MPEEWPTHFIKWNTAVRHIAGSANSLITHRGPATFPLQLWLWSDKCGDFLDVFPGHTGTHSDATQWTLTIRNNSAVSVVFRSEEGSIVPAKPWLVYTRLHGFTYRKKAKFIMRATKTSHLREYVWVCTQNFNSTADEGAPLPAISM